MEAKFQPEDYSELPYNPFVGKGRKILERYPLFKIYPEFNPSKVDPLLADMFEKVLTYVMILYQPNTPLLSLNTMSERKFQAALSAGFKINPDNNRFSVRIEKFISCDDEEVNRMILRMCMINNDHVFADLCMFEETLYKNDIKLLEGGNSKEKTKELIENKTRLRSLIRATKTEFLNQDANKNLIEMLYDHVDSSALGISAEDIATARYEGRLEKVIPNPHIDHE
jgi:hypothetical protein